MAHSKQGLICSLNGHDGQYACELTSKLEYILDGILDSSS